MELVMDTERARSLATLYGQRSDDVLEMASRLTSFLARAAMDDTYDVAGSLNLLSEDFHTGDVVLRHQADVMDGLTVDVDTLSQELGVDRWKVDKQLERVERGEINAGELLVSIVDFGQTDLTGLDTTIRDWLPDAPEIGTDPEFDALVQRLDGWLLSNIVDGRAVDADLLVGSRMEDLERLGELLGMPDLADLTVPSQIRHEEHQGRDEDRKVWFETIDVPLPTSEWGQWAFDWVEERLVDERKLLRMVEVPTLGELFDFSTYERAYERRVEQDEYETAYRTIDRTAEEVAQEIQKFNEEWKHLDWLPAVMAGHGVVPPALADNRVLQNQLVELARLFGYEGELSEAAAGVADTTASDPALAFLTRVGRQRIADALESPRAIQKARLPMAGPGLENAIELGRANGVITLDDERSATAVALHLSGLDPALDPATIDPAELEAEVPELNVEELVGLLATAVPPQHLTENRLLQTITYVQRAGTVGERMERIERVLLGLKSVVTVGEPAMTSHDWIRNLPTKVRQEEFDLDIQGEEFNWLLERSGVPGYHKSQDWNRGKGKRHFHLVNEADGALDDFVVEVVPKKKGWFGQALMTVAKVGMSIAFPPMGVAIAAMDAIIAATQGDWLAAGLGALGAVAAGAAVWASTATSAASTATSNAVEAAKALADGTGTLTAFSNASQAVSTASATANLANTAANAAQFVNAGVRAGVAFSQDDILGGIVNSVTAMGAGASGFGYEAVGQGLAGGAKVINAAGQTIEAAKNDDLTGFLAGGLGTAASLVDLSTTVNSANGTMSDQAIEEATKLANTIGGVADLTRAGGAIAEGIEEEQWASLVGSGLRFGSSALDLVGDQSGLVAGLAFDRTDEQGFADATNRFQTYGDWLDSAADLADSGLAFSRGDHLGGTALLSSGVSGLVAGDGFVATNLERLDSITNIADKVLAAGPGLDHATAMGLIGGEMQTLVDSFTPAPVPPTLSGSSAQRLAQARTEREAAQAGLATLDRLLTYDTTDGTVGTLLGSTRRDLAADVARWSTVEARAEAEYVAELAARREAAARLARHVPLLKPEVPSHYPMLKPEMPSHYPMARPGDLIPPGQLVTVQTIDGPVRMIANPDGVLVPVTGFETSAEQRAGAKMLDRTEQVASLELRIQELSGQLDQASGQDQLQLRRDIDQLQKRRDGLVRVMGNPNSQDGDYAAYDGSRFIIEGNLDASLYYGFDTDQDQSGGVGPRTPAVLGPQTMERLVADPAFQEELTRLMDGTADTPGAGRFQIDRTWSGEDFHIGRTWVDYWTKRNDDGTLTTTFRLTGDDGVKDVTVPPGSPPWLDRLMGADQLGPGNEIPGTRPYLYAPTVIDRITYPDHGHGLAASGDVVFDGQPFPAAAGQRGLNLPSSLDEFPLDHPVRMYQELASGGLLLPAPTDSSGDWKRGANVVYPTVKAGKHKLAFGPLAALSYGQKTDASGHLSAGYDMKLGWRAGVDGPLPILSGVQAGYAYDHFGGVDLTEWGVPLDLPGTASFQAVGPEPGVSPTELYDLAIPWAWPEGAAVKLGIGEGDEHHLKAGNTGDRRWSVFADRSGQTTDLLSVTNDGGQAVVSHGTADSANTVLGAAANVKLPWIPVLSEARFALGYGVNASESSTVSTPYGPGEADAYRRDLHDRQAMGGRPLTYTDAVTQTQQFGVDAKLGRPSPRFESGASESKALPLHRRRVASAQRPDGTWETTFDSGGQFWDRVTGTTTVDRNGAIESVEIESAVSPLLLGETIPFTLDTDAYVQVLEAIETDRDPVVALRGRPGIPDELYADPLTTARFRSRVVDDIQAMGDHAVHHPLPGNLRVRETPRGESILEASDPDGMDFRQTMVDQGRPDLANPAIENRVITASEVMDGLAEGTSEVVESWWPVVESVGGASAWAGTSAMDAVGLEDWVGPTTREWSDHFEHEQLPGLIDNGRVLADRLTALPGQTVTYAGQVIDDPARLPADAYAVGEATAVAAREAGVAAYDIVVDTADAAVTAWETGDGHAIGKGLAHAGAFGVETAVGVGLAGRAVRAGSMLRRSDQLVDGPTGSPGRSALVDGPAGTDGSGGGSDGGGAGSGPAGPGRPPDRTRFLVGGDGTAIDLDYLRSLRQVDDLPSSRSGKLPDGGRGEPNTFARAGDDHVVVYGPDGRAMADISSKRIKGVEWNPPDRREFMKWGSDTKVARDGTPDEVLEALGLDRRQKGGDDADQ